MLTWYNKKENYRNHLGETSELFMEKRFFKCLLKKSRLFQLLVLLLAKA